MGTFCLSSAPILRCESLTELQAKLLIIPTGLELIFSTTIIIAKWGHGRQHLLLVAEGWTYFCLALLEMLSHVIPAARVSLKIYSILDIILAATSFIPIVFYTLYLWLLVRDDLAPTLPKRFQRFATYILLLFIPAIVVLNELASLVGITRRLVNSTIAIGFQTSSNKFFWVFFTAFTLALLTAYQVLTFTLTFYRLVKAFVDLRRMESSSSTPTSTHLFKGIGWIAGGLKLGAIETVVGFIPDGGFGIAMTRRILRFLSRAFIIIGVVKGLDSFEDFNMLPPASKSRVSNPRYSTFQRLAGSPEEVKPRHKPLHLSSLSSDRVTVIASDGRPPMLQMRFSELDLNGFASSVVDRVMSRASSSDWSGRQTRSGSARALGRASSLTRASSSILPTSVAAYPTPPSGMTQADYSSTRRLTRDMHRSVDTLDSIEALRNIASQFPPLPTSLVTLPINGQPRLPPPSAVRSGQRKRRSGAGQMSSGSSGRRGSRSSSSHSAGSRHRPPPFVAIAAPPVSRTVQAYNDADSPVFREVDTPSPTSSSSSYSPPPAPAEAQSSLSQMLPPRVEGLRAEDNAPHSAFSADTTGPSDGIYLPSPHMPINGQNSPISTNGSESSGASSGSKDVQQASIMTARRVSSDLYSRRPESLIAAYRRARASTARTDVLREGEEYSAEPDPRAERNARPVHDDSDSSELPWTRREDVVVMTQGNGGGNASRGGAVARNLTAGAVGERKPSPLMPKSVSVGVGQVAKKSTPPPMRSDLLHLRESMTIEGIVVPRNHRTSRPQMEEIPYPDKLAAMRRLSGGHSESERSFFDD